MADVWNVGVASVDTSGNATFSGGVTATGVVNQNAAMTTGAGTGITTGTGTIVESSIQRHGNIVTTQIIVDITGLASGGTDLDIIGKDGDTANCHIGSLLATESGTPWGVRMTCLEVPTGSGSAAVDIDLYEATVATGVQDTAITALTNAALITAGGNWTIGLEKAMVAVPTAGRYLYLCNGVTGATGVYTAGRFLIEFTGYIA